MKNKQSISAIKKGMNKDASISQVTNAEYLFMVNGNTNNETGEGFNVQNEPSNRLGVIFPEGYKVVGFVKNQLKERTYYLLTSLEQDINSEHFRRSTIGYVQDSMINDINEDIESTCQDCQEYNELGTPLEQQIQVPSTVYVELVHDRCISLADIEDKGLNFNINFPIKKIEIKQEVLGTTLYWNDWRNPFRYLQIGRIEEAVENDTFDYLHTLDIACDDPIETECIDVDKLLVNPKHKRIILQAESEQIGGNLKMGTYEFWGAYCDAYGNEVTEYSTPTNPISIFDENNSIQAQTETDEFTNYSIKIKVNNLEKEKFKYYKIAVVERNNVSNTQSVFLVGIFPTTDDIVVYTHSGSSNDDLYITRGNISVKKRMDFNTLYAVKPQYKRAKGTMVTDNRLISFGLEEEQEINLQPVVNLFSSLTKFQTVASKETLYKSAIATSKYQGFKRDEVQPFALRFLYKDGGYSANFPMIGRPALPSDLVDVEDTNRSSIESNTPNCTSTERIKKWQLFNTAEVTGSCVNIEDGATTTQQPEKKTCKVEDVATISTDTINIDLDGQFFDLKSYIEDNYEEVIDPLSNQYIPEIAPYLVDPYTDDHCSVSFGDNCTSGVLTEYHNEISVVENEVQVKSEKPIIDYTPIKPPMFCSKYAFNTASGGYLGDVAFKTLLHLCDAQPVYKRDDSISNLSCSYAEDVVNATTIPNQTGSSYFYTNKGSLRANDLLSVIDTTGDNLKQNYEILSSTSGSISVDINGIIYTQTYTGSPTTTATDFVTAHKTAIELQTGGILTSSSGTITLEGALILIDTVSITGDVSYSYTVTNNFAKKLHNNALFFKIDKNSREKLVLEVTKESSCSLSDYVSNANKIRYTVFDKCGSYNILETGTFDPLVGFLELLDISSYPNTFYVALDTPFRGINRQNEECESCNIFISPGIFVPCTYKSANYLSTGCGCFSIFTRDVEYTHIEITWDSITIDKVEEYTSTCTYSIPNVDDCNPVPYQKGIFSYWESTVDYPDNKQLYDSSNLYISDEDLNILSEDDKAMFLEYYTDGLNVNQSYQLVNADFRCKPIRHFKFPDNRVAPFIYNTQSLNQFADSIIFPLGINLDSKVVISMLKVARNNNLITQRQLDNIQGYEILRGDNSIHKSIIASGLGYDMYNYNKGGEKWWYSNFPFNDLGNDKLHRTGKGENLIEHPFNGESNYMYSFLSPDIFLSKPTLPTEVSLTGYLYGNSKGRFVDVNKHPKWTIIGDKARQTAERLAIAEATLETISTIGNMVSSGAGGTWLSFGTSSGTSALGTALTYIQAGIVAGSLAVQTYVKIGQYRYQWLKTFRDLGSVHNFANYYVGEGKYNTFKVNTQDDDYLRGLSVRKHLKDELYSTIDENDGKKLNINSWLREHSVLLSTGENYKFQYLPEYSSFDNNTNPSSRSSKYIASEVGCNTNTDVFRDIASPYFTLKNYIPDQWDTIDSIKWLTTNYIFDLSDSTECSPIFGGTVFISRFSWKRKIPMFRTTAMGEPDKLPFNYSEYANVGFPNFFCDYETGGEYQRTVAFPDIDSDFVFDCETGRTGNYIKPPTKFYLYYYGISDFLVESEINCNFRHAKKEKTGSFYPQISDTISWTQESNLSIREPNTFFYNNTYSFPVSNTAYKYLDRTYDKDIWAKRALKENGWIWSEKDNNEFSNVDSWLVFKPLNTQYESTENGKLIDLRSIESNQFVGRFENAYQMFNQSNAVADAINNQTKETGTGFLYTRPVTFKKADLGFAGTQHTDFVSTPYGHFWADAKRGRVFQVDQNGGNMEIISESVQGKPTNMKQWFREHLPFKILNYLPNIDIDNKFKGIGLNIWWDDRFSRLFITKRDYILQQGIVKNDFIYDSQTKQLFYQEQEVFFDDTAIFKDVSWTITYKPEEGVWNSYFTFYPNYSPHHNGFFQSGYNWGQDQGTLWNHFGNNSSFQVFQGRLNPFIIEYPIQNENVLKQFNIVSLNIETRRYQNNWDFSIWKDKGFNRFSIYNNTQHSGILNLFPQKTLADNRFYPKTNLDNTQDILFTSENGKQNINYFFNRVKNMDRNIPMWLKDENNIFKDVNPRAVSFTGKRNLERFLGDTAVVRLENNTESRFNIILKSSINDETILE